MADWGTFSAAVDEAARRARRPDRKDSFQSYLRSSVREVQADALYPRDMIEAQLTATTDPYVWTTPTRFRSLLVAQLPALSDAHGKPLTYAERAPSKAQQDFPVYLYMSGNDIVFTGHGSGTYTINIAYYVLSRPFIYYALESDRPATYDQDTETWSYASADTEATQEVARDQVSNWLYERHFDSLVLGALAKQYAEVADQRGSVTYSLWQQFLKTIWKTEGAVLLGQQKQH